MYVFVLQPATARPYEWAYQSLAGLLADAEMPYVIVAAFGAPSS